VEIAGSCGRELVGESAADVASGRDSSHRAVAFFATVASHSRIKCENKFDAEARVAAALFAIRCVHAFLARGAFCYNLHWI
jgi:hypothetical protein